MPVRVQWYYHRSGCETCRRSQRFLRELGIEPREVVGAQRKFGPDEALALARKAERVIACRGPAVVLFDMKRETPDRQTLLKHLLGPHGNLRAPALLAGKILIVGFNADGYAQLLL